MIRFPSERSRGGRLSLTMWRFSEGSFKLLWLGRYLITLRFFLMGGGMRRGPTPFRFENMWLKEEGFQEVLRKWWEGDSSLIAFKKQNAWNIMDFWDKEESVRSLSLEEEEARKEAREMYKKWVLLEEVSWR
ncbi:hypothetical protein CK203_014500 [Vitis vinifera]|uniref:Uncharacterized protein n=1 Tax=Vitis vinifera TaxID=29760 RepID=A0A438K4X0_VITVI|nr:hypothetical protein CK203_014500 [Vitis vinifera]